MSRWLWLLLLPTSAWAYPSQPYPCEDPVPVCEQLVRDGFYSQNEAGRQRWMSCVGAEFILWREGLCRLGAIDCMGFVDSEWTTWPCPNPPKEWLQ